MSVWSEGWTFLGEKIFAATGQPDLRFCPPSENCSGGGEGLLSRAVAHGSFPVGDSPPGTLRGHLLGFKAELPVPLPLANREAQTDWGPVCGLQMHG